MQSRKLDSIVLEDNYTVFEIEECLGVYNKSYILNITNTVSSENTNILLCIQDLVSIYVSLHKFCETELNSFNDTIELVNNGFIKTIVNITLDKFSQYLNIEFTIFNILYNFTNKKLYELTIEDTNKLYNVFKNIILTFKPI